MLEKIIDTSTIISLEGMPLNPDEAKEFDKSLITSDEIFFKFVTGNEVLYNTMANRQDARQTKNT